MDTQMMTEAQINETENWNQFHQSYQNQLAPDGPLEATLATEIIYAAWRLRRCNLSEATTDITPDLENAIDRARNQAQRHFSRNLNELKRLQTERQFRQEYFPVGTDLSALGVASIREILPALANCVTLDPVKRENAMVKALHSVSNRTQNENWVRSAKSNPASVQTPRNATCPCGSGQKYKRCCGTNAPAILGLAA